jgi:heme exporter protein CcmB
MNGLVAIFWREARLAWAGGGGAAGPAAFFLAAITLAPLAIGPAPDLLMAAGPGLMGFAALLSVCSQQNAFMAMISMMGRWSSMPCSPWVCH